jgi:NAD(P)-dependent dehydrogenase (short-subunit alcohol dehydrogenase family)
MTERQELPLAGWAALVTGGGSGIGLGAAKRLAADGASVVLSGRSPDRLADGAGQVRAVAAPGAEVREVPCDVTQEDQVVAAVAAARELGGGRLHATVISAGGSETIGPLTQIDTDAWRRTLDLNVTGAWLVIKHAGGAMASGGGGSIVAVSSVASAVTHRWYGAYGPAKAALDHLCQVAADELGPSGVRVNTVQPGLTRTDLTTMLMDADTVLGDYLSQMPLGRVGEVEDVSGLVRFLIGPEASWITGQTIGVDGGHALRRGPDLSSMLEPLFGPEGLRGVVK